MSLLEAGTDCFITNTVQLLGWSKITFVLLHIPAQQTNSQHLHCRKGAGANTGLLYVQDVSIPMLPLSLNLAVSTTIECASGVHFASIIYSDNISKSLSAQC